MSVRCRLFCARCRDLLAVIVVFDLDDTLYLERDYVRSGFTSVGNWCATEWGVHGIAEEAWRLFESGIRERIFDQALGATGIVVGPTSIAAMVEVYRSHSPHIALSEDASWILATLGDGFPLCLLSDGYAMAQDNKIDALGVRSVFSQIVLTDTLGANRQYWKPSPEPFRLVMQRFVGKPQNYVYVGDNPAKDFIGARALGWSTVRLRCEGQLHFAASCYNDREADISIDSLYKLPAVLEDLR